MTKILFLTLWYCAIYPTTFFMCSFTLFVNYFTDRFSLMRTWKRASQLGSKISKFSRNIFFPIAIICMAVVSSLFWSGYPFDNLCEDGHSKGSYIGDYVVRGENVMVSAQTTMYVSCLQNFMRTGHGFTFPFIPEQQEGYDAAWMTDEQEEITFLFGWFSVSVVLAVVLKLFVGCLSSAHTTLYGSNHEVSPWCSGLCWVILWVGTGN